MNSIVWRSSPTWSCARSPIVTWRDTGASVVAVRSIPWPWCTRPGSSWPPERLVPGATCTISAPWPRSPCVTFSSTGPRARAAVRRGGAFEAISLDDAAIAIDDEPERLVAIDDALMRLTALAPRLARVVELRFFGALSDAEIASEVGVNVRTVQRDWTKARALLEELMAT